MKRSRVVLSTVSFLLLAGLVYLTCAPAAYAGRAATESVVIAVLKRLGLIGDDLAPTGAGAATPNLGEVLDEGNTDTNAAGIVDLGTLTFAAGAVVDDTLDVTGDLTTDGSIFLDTSGARIVCTAVGSAINPSGSVLAWEDSAGGLSGQTISSGRFQARVGSVNKIAGDGTNNSMRLASDTPQQWSTTTDADGTADLRIRRTAAEQLTVDDAGGGAISLVVEGTIDADALTGATFFGVRLTVESHAAGGTLTQGESGSYHDNAGAGASDITLTLPTPADGLLYAVKTVDAGTITLDPPAGSQFTWSGGTMADGENLHVQGGGSTVTFVCNGSNWNVLSEQGSITEETP